MKSYGIFIPLAIIIGCSSSTEGSAECFPGDIQECFASDNCEAVQSCAEDGSGFGECRCLDKSTSPNGTGGSVASVSNNDAGANSSSSGSGGSENTLSNGNDAGANNDSDAGKDPTDPTCQPKSCATISMEMSDGDPEAFACGRLEDGCGGYVDCTCEGYDPNWDDAHNTCEQNFCVNRCGGGPVAGRCGIGGATMVASCEPTTDPHPELPPRSNCYLSPDYGVWCCP